MVFFVKKKISLVGDEKSEVEGTTVSWSFCNKGIFWKWWVFKGVANKTQPRSIYDSWTPWQQQGPVAQARGVDNKLNGDDCMIGSLQDSAGRVLSKAKYSGSSSLVV